MSKVSLRCRGCGKNFFVSPSRAKTASFCTSDCYLKHQDFRNSSRTHWDDLIGKRFHRLTVLRREKGKFVCQCDCGEPPKAFYASALVNNRIKSCGCYNREKSRKDPTITSWLAWIRYLKFAAKHRYIQFHLSFEDIKDLCSQACAYCGRRPSPWFGPKNSYLASCKNKGTREPDLVFAESKVIQVNGLDRVDSSGHYVLSNVVPCCTDCNLAKLDRSETEFKEWIRRAYLHLFAETDL